MRILKGHNGVRLALLLLASLPLTVCARRDSGGTRPPPAPAGGRAALQRNFQSSPGNPNATALLLDRGKLYVALGRRQGFQAAATGLVAVLDAATNEVLDSIPLAHKNPMSLAAWGGKLYVAASGEVYGRERGAVEEIDPDGHRASTLITSDALGGDPIALQLKDGPTAYVLVRTGHGRAKLVEANLCSGRLLSTLAGPDDVQTFDYEPDEKLLWVGRRREDLLEGQGEVEVFDDRGRRAAGPFRASLAPFHLLRAGSPGARRTFLVGSDLETGALAWTGEGKPQPFARQELRVYQDSELRRAGGRLFVLERYGADNLLGLDPHRPEAGPVYRVHLGERWNPVDLAGASESKVFVALENRPEILVFDPQARIVTGSIDISRFASQ